MYPRPPAHALRAKKRLQTAHIPAIEQAALIQRGMRPRPGEDPSQIVRHFPEETPPVDRGPLPNGARPQIRPEVDQQRQMQLQKLAAEMAQRAHAAPPAPPVGALEAVRPLTATDHANAKLRDPEMVERVKRRWRSQGRAGQVGGIVRA